MGSNNNDNERERLVNEINDLKSQLLWYKRTYEERSLFGIILERLKGNKKSSLTKPKRRFRGFFAGKANIAYSAKSQMLPVRVLCTVVNHNHNENAKKLVTSLSTYFDTVLLDSGSPVPPANAVLLPNVYYSGLLNHAYDIMRKNGYDWLMFVCSDVEVSDAAASAIFERLTHLDYSVVGLYAPSSSGADYDFCRTQPGNGTREVPFVEGFMFLCELKILTRICPIDTKKNLYGWGLDLAKGFFARQSGKKCLIDDSVEVHHPPGSGYSRQLAEYEMLTWAKGMGNAALLSFFQNQMEINGRRIDFGAAYDGK